ncbi:MAG: hypothetical protein OXU64_10710 [Gemmatimonadota bacterium]|nr:hypothetical protein [Gemmatimonadota bacterium]
MRARRQAGRTPVVGGVKHSLHRISVAGALALCANAPALAGQQANRGDVWISHPDFEIGEGATGTGLAAFGTMTTVRSIGDSLLLVTEPWDSRVTIWTPGGTLVARVGGPGEGPGEFSHVIMSVGVHRDGFSVRDDVRFTSFSNAGELLGTTPFPPPPSSFRGYGLRPRALLEDGSVLAVPGFSNAAMMEVYGDDPVEMLPVLRLAEEGGRWGVDTIAILDNRNHDFSIIPEGHSAFGGGIHGAQPLGDFDLTFFEPALGTVVVLRRNLGGGLVELVEIEADGDTILQRRVATSPVTLDRDRIASYVDRLARSYSRPGSLGSSFPYRALRAAIEEALYVPNPLPGARTVHGTASGEIWFRGFETEDSLSPWYAVSRDGTTPGLRRVLLPPGFSATDATDTHVLGIRRDELGVEYVVGRRLVPLAASGSSEGG